LGKGLKDTVPVKVRLNSWVSKKVASSSSILSLSKVFAEDRTKSNGAAKIELADVVSFFAD
jgi:hypothetical protein